MERDSHTLRKRSYDDDRTIVYENHRHSTYRDGGRVHSLRDSRITSATTRSQNDLFNFSGTFQQIVERSSSSRQHRNIGSDAGDEYDADFKKSLFSQLAIFESKLKQRDGEIAFLRDENNRLRCERDSWKDKAVAGEERFARCKVAVENQLKLTVSIYEKFKSDA